MYYINYSSFGRSLRTFRLCRYTVFGTVDYIKKQFSVGQNILIALKTDLRLELIKFTINSSK
ncbi:unnamed protein product [Paramecium sonneborni]|uniref:Uncharacterized protein n=1 Tax=Paramecium sonneborni TaxID=65129 RepID=A0A8S1QY79_9CILI|nr:unnamed protein product [Paramecium sonneborni]